MSFDFGFAKLIIRQRIYLAMFSITRISEPPGLLQLLAGRVSSSCSEAGEC